MGVTRDATQD